MSGTRPFLGAAAVFTIAVALAPQAPSDHPGTYDRVDIDAGGRLYATQCVACHGANGDMVPGIDLRRGQFRTAVSDEDLTRVLTNGSPSAGMPAFGSYGSRDLQAIVAYIRAGFDRDATAIKIGDPERGSVLFSGKAGCTMCHRVSGRGPHTATDLSDIGLTRSAASLQRALIDPAGAMMPANRAVRAMTRDGRTVRGRRMNEDTYSVQLIDEEGRLLSLTKADLRTLEMIDTSSMPSYATRLTADEQADVIAYLLSLKGL
jgi:putative heme-binding domain-containing protein